MCIQNLIKLCPLVLKILGGNGNYDGMTELQNDRIKGRNSVANLQKMMIYNTNIDLVNDNVYTKSG